MEQVKKHFELDIINLMLNGLNPKDISKQLNISMPNLSYYLSKLKAKGCIKRVGYGTWEVVKTLPKDTIEVRAHAFIWKVKIPKKINNWDKRLEILTKNNIKFKIIGKNTPRLIIKGKKVWLGNKNIIIYEPHSFMAKNSLEARRLAVFSLLEIIQAIEKKLSISLKSSEGYLFTPKREHYSLIKNQLAQQVNKSGEKLYVYDKSGTWWFCMDKSYNLDEAETQTTKETRGLVQNLGAQKYFNEHKDTKWEVSPKFVLNVMNGIQQNQLVFDKNMSSHIQAIQELGKGVKKLTKVMKGILKENQSLKLSAKNQKTLDKFIT